jgi:hypothetical protein
MIVVLYLLFPSCSTNLDLVFNKQKVTGYGPPKVLFTCWNNFNMMLGI